MQLREEGKLAGRLEGWEQDARISSLQTPCVWKHRARKQIASWKETFHL